MLDAIFTAPVLGAMITAAVTINLTFFRWLIGKFKLLDSEIHINRETVSKMLDSHESQDQRRHEENLYRFEKISVALARMGSTNGTH